MVWVALCEWGGSVVCAGAVASAGAVLHAHSHVPTIVGATPGAVAGERTEQEELHGNQQVRCGPHSSPLCLPCGLWRGVDWWAPRQCITQVTLLAPRPCVPYFSLLRPSVPTQRWIWSMSL